MPSVSKPFFNYCASSGYKSGVYKRNSIQLALKQVNFKFHRINSSSVLSEDLNSTEQIILSTVYGSEDSNCVSQKHIPLLMATNTPNSQNEREHRCTEQQTELCCGLTPGICSPGTEGQRGPAAALYSSPVAPPGRPPSILGSVCALLLSKQASPPKDVAGVSERSSNICRICFGGESGAQLVRPCSCRGTIAAVHRACLERWLLAAATSYCELCRHHYVVTRRHKWSLWRSVWEWTVSGGGRALAADVARGVLLGAASVLGTARALHVADALLHAAAAKGGAAALAANVFSSVLIGIIGALNGLLTTWMLLKVQEHQASWRAWRASTALVRVALDEPTPSPTPPPLTDPPTTTSSSASFSSVVSGPAEPPPERATDDTLPVPSHRDLHDT